VVLAAGAHAGHFGALAAIGLSPVSAVIGAAMGAGAAEPVFGAGALQQTLERAMVDADVRATVRDAVLEAAAGRTAHPPRFVRGAGPARPDERPTYRDLAEGEIDTVLEITVTGARLEPVEALEHRSNPVFALSLEARTRLVAVADGRDLDARTITSKAGGYRTFTAWAADGAAGVRPALAQAARDVAEVIVRNVIGAPPIAAQPAQVSPEGDDHARD
jgi:hypothetical protein